MDKEVLTMEQSATYQAIVRRELARLSALDVANRR